MSPRGGSDSLGGQGSSPTGTQEALVSFAAPRPQGPGEWSLQAHKECLSPAHPGGGGGQEASSQVATVKMQFREDSASLSSPVQMGKLRPGWEAQAPPAPRLSAPQGTAPILAGTPSSPHLSPLAHPPGPQVTHQALQGSARPSPPSGCPCSPAPEVRKLSLLEGVFPHHPAVVKSEHTTPER